MGLRVAEGAAGSYEDELAAGDFGVLVFALVMLAMGLRSRTCSPISLGVG